MGHIIIVSENLMLKCCICKAVEFEYAFSSAYESTPWVDGRVHRGVMCHCCYEVPKMHHYDEESKELTVYHEMYYNRLCTVDELVAEGFDKKDAQRSIRAVKALVRKRKK